MLFTGWEVRIGRNCALGLEYRPRPTASDGTQTEGTVSPNTDRPRPVINIFIFFPTKFQENFTSASKPCVLKYGEFVLMKRAIDCLKPKQNITETFLTCTLYYHNYALF